MKKATIFTYRFFDFENEKVRIGGIETYTLDLALLLTKIGYETTVYTALDNVDTFNECNYKGFKIKEISKGKSFDTSFQELYTSLDAKGLYIIMTDDMKINTTNKHNVISIQHGISWDNPSWAFSKKFQKPFTYAVRKLQNCYKHISIFKKTSNMVCVDYNYYNWIRTLHEIPENMHIAVIPNYASGAITQEEFDKKQAGITDLKKSRIVLARRLTRYRGAQLFADVVTRLLKKYPELDITIAGDGDLEEKLKADFADNKSVHMTKYSAEQSIDFHKQFDIAVVPTIYSEGTSLSLCEAMAAGCMPVATHVGGLTNLIIDSFNGKLCYPCEEAVFSTLDELLNMDISSYKKMLSNAYNTYVSSLNKGIWEKRWTQYINSIKH